MAFLDVSKKHFHTILKRMNTIIYVSDRHRYSTNREFSFLGVGTKIMQIKMLAHEVSNI